MRKLNCEGVIGTTKIQFDIWGDAVNVASRMESTGLEGRIQVSPSAFEKLQQDNVFEERGVQVTNLFDEDVI